MKKSSPVKKTIEYREMKPYWTIRIFNEVKRGVMNCCPKLREQIKTLSLQEYLKIAKIDPVVFDPLDSLTLQCLFRLGYGTEKLSATIIKIEIVDGKDTDLHIDKPVYAIHFYLQNNMQLGETQ